MATHPKFTQVPRVILDVLDVVSRHQLSYSESFMSIYLLLAEIYAKQKNRHIVIMATHPKLTQVPSVIHDILDDVGRPQGSYPESFVSLTLFLVEI